MSFFSIDKNSHSSRYWMFKAALFIVTSTWKQPRCPSVGEWVNRAWYIHTMEYYLAIKRDELLSHKKDEEEP